MIRKCLMVVCDCCEINISGLRAFVVNGNEVYCDGCIGDFICEMKNDTKVVISVEHMPEESYITEGFKNA
jgi:hypothetical protein